MFDRNADIKKAKGNIPHWAIAEKLGIHEQTWYAKLRKELSTDQKKRIFAVIEDLKREIEVEQK